MIRVRRMDDSRLPKRVFNGELSSGRGLKRPYKDRLKEALSYSTSLPYSTWKVPAIDRPLWRAESEATLFKFQNRLEVEREDRSRESKDFCSPCPKLARPRGSPAPNVTGSSRPWLAPWAPEKPPHPPSSSKRDQHTNGENQE